MTAPGTARLQPGESDRPTDKWHSRGYLPHFESRDAIQHVTYHLADSLPASATEQLQDELRTLPPDRRKAERRRRIHDLLDAGHGCCILREPWVAEMVQDSFWHFDGQRYRLFAWVVMPNHVHVVFQPLEGWTVSLIVGSWKSFTGRRIAEHMRGLQRGGRQAGGRRSRWRSQGGASRVWQREYWDRFMRDEHHFWTAVAYVHNNPVKAGLVESAEEWPWSSAAIGGAKLKDVAASGGPRRPGSW